MGAIKALRALLGVLLCALLALSLWLTAQRQVLGREEAQLFGYTLKAVETSAMEPALPQGGLAAVAASPSYELGDPVLCGAGTFTRLVGAVDGDFIARGDGQGEEAEALLSPGTSGERWRPWFPGQRGFTGSSALGGGRRRFWRRGRCCCPSPPFWAWEGTRTPRPKGAGTGAATPAGIEKAPSPLGEGAFFAATDQRSRYQRKVSFRWESSQLSGYMLFCQSKG